MLVYSSYSQVERAGDENFELQRQIDVQKADFTSEKAALDAAIAKLNEDLHVAKQEIEDLRGSTRVLELEAMLEAIRDQYENANAEKNELLTAQAQLEQQLLLLQEELDNLRENQDEIIEQAVIREADKRKAAFEVLEGADQVLFQEREKEDVYRARIADLEAELADVTNQNKLYEQKYGIEDAMNEVRNLQIALRTRDNEIARLTRMTGGSLDNYDILMEITRRFMAQLGIPEDTDPFTLFDDVTIREGVQSTCDRLRALNRELTIQNDALEEQRLRLLRQLRVHAEQTGGALKYYGLTSEQLAVVNEFAENLRDGRVEIPVTDLSLELSIENRKLREKIEVLEDALLSSKADTLAAREEARVANNLADAAMAASRNAPPAIAAVTESVSPTAVNMDADTISRVAQETATETARATQMAVLETFKEVVEQNRILQNQYQTAMEELKAMRLAAEKTATESPAKKVSSVVSDALAKQKLESMALQIATSLDKDKALAEKLNPHHDLVSYFQRKFNSQDPIAPEELPSLTEKLGTSLNNLIEALKGLASVHITEKELSDSLAAQKRLQEDLHKANAKAMQLETELKTLRYELEKEGASKLVMEKTQLQQLAAIQSQLSNLQSQAKEPGSEGDSRTVGLTSQLLALQSRLTETQTQLKEAEHAIRLLRADKQLMENQRGGVLGPNTAAGKELLPFRRGRSGATSGDLPVRGLLEEEWEAEVMDVRAALIHALEELAVRDKEVKLYESALGKAQAKLTSLLGQQLQLYREYATEKTLLIKERDEVRARIQREEEIAREAMLKAQQYDALTSVLEPTSQSKENPVAYASNASEALVFMSDPVAMSDTQNALATLRNFVKGLCRKVTTLEIAAPVLSRKVVLLETEAAAARVASVNASLAAVESETHMRQRILYLELWKKGAEARLVRLNEYAQQSVPSEHLALARQEIDELRLRLSECLQFEIEIKAEYYKLRELPAQVAKQTARIHELERLNTELEAKQLKYKEDLAQARQELIEAASPQPLSTTPGTVERDAMGRRKLPSTIPASVSLLAGYNHGELLALLIEQREKVNDMEIQLAGLKRQTELSASRVAELEGALTSASARAVEWEHKAQGQRMDAAQALLDKGPSQLLKSENKSSGAGEDPQTVEQLKEENESLRLELQKARGVADIAVIQAETLTSTAKNREEEIQDLKEAVRVLAASSQDATSVGKLQAQLLALKAAFHTFARRHESVRAALRNERFRANTLETALDSKSGQLMALQEETRIRNMAMENLLFDLRTQLRQIKNSGATLTRMSDLHQSLRSLARALEGTTQQVEPLRARVDDLEGKIAELEQENRALNVQLKDLKPLLEPTSSSSVPPSTRDIMKRMDGLHETLRIAQLEALCSRRQLATLREEKKLLQTRCSDYAEHIAALESAVVNAESAAKQREIAYSQSLQASRALLGYNLHTDANASEKHGSANAPSTPATAPKTPAPSSTTAVASSQALVPGTSADDLAASLASAEETAESLRRLSASLQASHTRIHALRSLCREAIDRARMRRRHIRFLEAQLRSLGLDTVPFASAIPEDPRPIVLDQDPTSGEAGSASTALVIAGSTDADLVLDPQENFEFDTPALTNREVGSASGLTPEEELKNVKQQALANINALKSVIERKNSLIEEYQQRLQQQQEMIVAQKRAWEAQKETAIAAAVSDAGRTISELHGSIATLRNAPAPISTPMALAQLTEKVQTLDEAIRERDLTIDRLARQLALAREEAKALSTVQDSLQSELRKTPVYTEEIVQKEKEEAVTKAVAEAKQEFQATIAKKEGHIKDLQSALKELKAQIVAFYEDKAVKDLQEKYSPSARNISNDQTSTSVSAGAEDAKKQDSDSLADSQKLEVEKRVAKLAQELSSLQSQATTLQKSNSSLVTELRTLRDENATLKRECASLQETLATLNANKGPAAPTLNTYGPGTARSGAGVAASSKNTTQLGPSHAATSRSIDASAAVGTASPDFNSPEDAETPRGLRTPRGGPSSPSAPSPAALTRSQLRMPSQRIRSPLLQLDMSTHSAHGSSANGSMNGSLQDSLQGSLASPPSNTQRRASSAPGMQHANANATGGSLLSQPIVASSNALPRSESTPRMATARFDRDSLVAGPNAQLAVQLREAQEMIAVLEAQKDLLQSANKEREVVVSTYEIELEKSKQMVEKLQEELREAKRSANQDDFDGLMDAAEASHTLRADSIRAASTGGATGKSTGKESSNAFQEWSEKASLRNRITKLQKRISDLEQEVSSLTKKEHQSSLLLNQTLTDKAALEKRVRQMQDAMSKKEGHALTVLQHIEPLSQLKAKVHSLEMLLAETRMKAESLLPAEIHRLQAQLEMEKKKTHAAIASAEDAMRRLQELIQLGMLTPEAVKKQQDSNKDGDKGSSSKQKQDSSASQQQKQAVRVILEENIFVTEANLRENLKETRRLLAIAEGALLTKEAAVLESKLFAEVQIQKIDVLEKRLKELEALSLLTGSNKSGEKLLSGTENVIRTEREKQRERDLTELVESLKTLAERQRKEIDRLKKDVATRTKELNDTRKKPAEPSVMALLEASQTEIKRLKLRLQAAESQNMHGTSNLTGTGGPNTSSLDRSITVSKRDKRGVDALDAQMQQLQRDLESKNREIRSLQSQLQETARQGTVSEQESAQISAKAAALTSVKYEEEKKKLEDRIQSLERQNQRKEESAKQLQQTLEIVTNQFNKLKEELGNLKEARDKKQEAGTSGAPSTEEVRRLKSKIAELQSENEKLTSDLNAFDLSFFQELEDLKYNYSEALKKCKEFDEYKKQHPPTNATA